MPFVNSTDALNPEHYKHGKYETITKMLIIFGPTKTKAFCDLNVFKYTDRANFKSWNAAEDRDKADMYTLFSSLIDEGRTGAENAKIFTDRLAKLRGKNKQPE